MTEVLVADASVEYPTSDGRPVAETPLHYERLAEAWHALRVRFGSQPGTVGANILALGVGLWLDDAVLRFHDPNTGQDLLAPREEALLKAESDARAKAEASRADAEAALRRRLEAELAELSGSSAAAP